MPQPDTMLVIWENVSQPFPDGKRYIEWKSRVDIDYLYDTGFVDTDKFKKEEWIDAFKDSRRADGVYLITKEQWLAKRPFRFEGATAEPFEPLSLREGEWNFEEFDKILKERVFPSTSLSEDIFRKAIEKGRDKAFVGDKFILSKAFKFAIKQAFLLHPSPRRLRELAVAEARGSLAAKREAERTRVAAASGSLAKSGYASGPSKEKTARDQLSELLWKGRR